MKSLFEDDEIRKLISTEDAHSTAYGALVEARFLAGTYTRLQKKKMDIDLKNFRAKRNPYTKAANEAFSAVSAINQACLVGYLWAYAEVIRFAPD